MKKPVNRQFSVELEKETLIFSAAHFITFGNNICESLHGHNYRVACRVTGALDEHACVVDFIWLRDQLKKFISELDHHVLLPNQHSSIKVVHEANEYVVTFEDRRWVFPEQDVALLPMDNTTAERLAEYLASRLLDVLAKAGIEQISILELGVDENEGQWAWCRMNL